MEFTGTIKVIFKDTASLQQAIIRDKIKISLNQRCSIDKWVHVHTVKVRHCYKCLKFGHVSYS